MIIEILIYPAIIFLAATMAVKLIERRRQELDGPSIAGCKSARLRRKFSRVAGQFTSVGIRASAIVG